MAQTVLLQPLSLEARLANWNLVRGIENQYDVPMQNPGLTGIELPTNAPSAFSIDAGVITVTPRHLPENAVEVDSMDIVTDQGTFDLMLEFRDWFPDDSPVPLSTFHSIFRSVDPSERELWRGVYWHSLPGSGNLNTTEDIIVMSDEDGYLNFAALVNQLAALDSEGLLYVTQISDQIGGHHLVASEDREPLAVVVHGGASSTYTARMNGHAFVRGRWAPNDAGGAWSQTNRDDSELRNASAPLENYWGIVTVQQKYNATHNRLFHFGDSNSFPGIRDTSAVRYRYNTSAASKPGILFPGTNTWFAPHCVMMDAYMSVAGTTFRSIRSVRLEDVADHDSQSTTGLASDIHSGDGRELDFQDYHWAEGMVFDLPQSTDAAVRQTNIDNWIATRTNIANNLTSLMGNANLNYDLT